MNFVLMFGFCLVAVLSFAGGLFPMSVYTFTAFPLTQRAFLMVFHSVNCLMCGLPLPGKNDIFVSLQ